MGRYFETGVGACVNLNTKKRDAISQRSVASRLGNENLSDQVSGVKDEVWKLCGTTAKSFITTCSAIIPTARLTPALTITIYMYHLAQEKLLELKFSTKLNLFVSVSV
ncbi:hypothetical protein Bbelb_029840 [Branchiostoma belcheri]|nr:hypothetical protein Bbelb_029840 [Branchiostoma belcheri]